MGGILLQYKLPLVAPRMLFQVVYDRELPSMRAYTSGEACLPAIHHQFMDRDELLLHASECLEQAQDHYKPQYDCKHRELEFSEGDWVWLCLIYRLITSLNVASHGKLGPKLYGTFQVLQ
jgi:hypothetical protein